VRHGEPPLDGRSVEPLRGWIGLVRGAQDPCLVLDRSGRIAACSMSAVVLLGLTDPVTVVGRPLLDGEPYLVNFTASNGRLSDWELGRIPPLLVLSTGRLARGVLRIRQHQRVRTVDAVTTPLHHDGELAGSLTFFREL
jgi:hypothetical protein